MSTQPERKLPEGSQVSRRADKPGQQVIIVPIKIGDVPAKPAK